uniref:Amine oxidase domain-containing protein n=1 Tax=Timema tahoe TaxID=61484 RepID=A0A7R9ILR6_9NEOP|nr:unnamed protein product [Timema tahoe]
MMVATRFNEFNEDVEDLMNLPSIKTFVMKQHYAPRKSILAERVRLGKRFQREGESIAEYAMEIKHIAASCNYGAFLGETLHDRLVSGLLSQEIPRKLMAEVEITFQEALNVGLRLEEADRQVKVFHSQPGSSCIDNVYKLDRVEGCRSTKSYTEGRTYGQDKGGVQIAQYGGGKSWLQDVYSFHSIDSSSTVLLGWVIGRSALIMERLPETEVLDGCMELLQRFCGKTYNIPKAEQVTRSNWGTNPHFLGCYSYRSVDSDVLGVSASQLAIPVVNSQGKEHQRELLSLLARVMDTVSHICTHQWEAPVSALDKARQQWRVHNTVISGVDSVMNKPW